MLEGLRGELQNPCPVNLSSVWKAEESGNETMVPKDQGGKINSSIQLFHLCHLPTGMPLAGWAIQPLSQVQMSRFLSYSIVSCRWKDPEGDNDDDDFDYAHGLRDATRIFGYNLY